MDDEIMEMLRKLPGNGEQYDVSNVQADEN